MQNNNIFFTVCSQFKKCVTKTVRKDVIAFGALKVYTLPNANKRSPVAQGIKHWPSDLAVPGSSPA